MTVVSPHNNNDTTKLADETSDKQEEKGSVAATAISESADDSPPGSSDDYQFEYSVPLKEQQQHQPTGPIPESSTTTTTVGSGNNHNPLDIHEITDCILAASACSRKTNSPERLDKYLQSVYGDTRPRLILHLGSSSSNSIMASSMGPLENQIVHFPSLTTTGRQTTSSVPTLSRTLQFCYALSAWLDTNTTTTTTHHHHHHQQRPLAIIMCQNGRTQTAIAVACFLKFAGVVDCALQGFCHFLEQRCRIHHPELMVQVPPSLQTLFTNFDAVVGMGTYVNPHPLVLRAITLQGVPVEDRPCVDVWDGQGQHVYSSHAQYWDDMATTTSSTANTTTTSSLWAEEEGFYHVNCRLHGDFLLVCRFGGPYAGDIHDTTKVLFRYANSTAFVSAPAPLEVNSVDVPRRYALALETESDEFVLSLAFDAAWAVDTDDDDDHDTLESENNNKNLPPVFSGLAAQEAGWHLITECHAVQPTEAHVDTLIATAMGELDACPRHICVLALQLANADVTMAQTHLLEGRLRSWWQHDSHDDDDSPYSTTTSGVRSVVDTLERLSRSEGLERIRDLLASGAAVLQNKDTETTPATTIPCSAPLMRPHPGDISSRLSSNGRHTTTSIQPSVFAGDSPLFPVTTTNNKSLTPPRLENLQDDAALGVLLQLEHPGVGLEDLVATSARHDDPSSVVGLDTGQGAGAATRTTTDTPEETAATRTACEEDSDTAAVTIESVVLEKEEPDGIALNNAGEIASDASEPPSSSAKNAAAEAAAIEERLGSPPAGGINEQSPTKSAAAEAAAAAMAKRLGSPGPPSGGISASAAAAAAEKKNEQSPAGGIAAAAAALAVKKKGEQSPANSAAAEAAAAAMAKRLGSPGPPAGGIAAAAAAAAAKKKSEASPAKSAAAEAAAAAMAKRLGSPGPPAGGIAAAAAAAAAKKSQAPSTNAAATAAAAVVAKQAGASPPESEGMVGGTAGSMNEDDAPLKEHPKYQKYFKMLKMGLPRGAVENAMQRDEIDSFILDLNPDKSLNEQTHRPDAEAPDPPLKDDPTYAKYFKMRKMGLPEGAVRNAMQRDNVDDFVLGLDPEKSLKSQVQPPQSAPDNDPPLKDDPKYEKYFKMMKMGLPNGAVRNAMERDGADPTILDLDPEKSIQSQMKKDVRDDGVPLKDDPTFQKYFKMLKMGLPAGAVQNAMQRDGVDHTVLDLDPEKSLQSQQKGSSSEAGGSVDDDGVPIKDDPAFQKYFKMLQMGLPQGAVRNAMERDGVDSSILDLDPNRSLVSQQGKADDGVPLKEDPEWSKYFKMMKMGLPLGAIKNAVERDGKDPSILDLDHSKSIASQQKTPLTARSTAKKKKKVRRKKIYWNPLDSKQIKADSIWSRVKGTVQMSELNYDPKEFADLFTESTDPADRKTPKKKKNTASAKKSVQVIDGKRSMNGGIILARLKMDYKKIASMVDQMNSGSFDSNTIKSLKELLPNDDERRGLLAYMEQAGSTEDEKSKAYNDFSECEKYMFTMLDVENAASKFDSMLFRSQFQGRLDELLSSIRQVEKACDEVRSSEKLRIIMAMILTLVNEINTGGDGNEAAGFTLDALLKLNEAKAFDKKTSVLHYLVKLLKRNDETLLAVKDDLKHIKEAELVILDSLCGDIQTLSGEIEPVKETVEAQAAQLEEAGELSQMTLKELSEQRTSVLNISHVPQYNKVLHHTGRTPMERFTISAEMKLNEAVKFTETVQDKFSKLLDYFGEDKGMASNDFFGIMNKFFVEFDNAIQQVKREELAKKREAAKRAKEEQKKLKKKGADASPSPAKVSESKNGVKRQGSGIAALAAAVAAKKKQGTGKRGDVEVNEETRTTNGDNRDGVAAASKKKGVDMGGLAALAAAAASKKKSGSGLAVMAAASKNSKPKSSCGSIASLATSEKARQSRPASGIAAMAAAAAAAAASKRDKDSNSSGGIAAMAAKAASAKRNAEPPSRGGIAAMAAAAASKRSEEAKPSGGIAALAAATASKNTGDSRLPDDIAAVAAEAASKKKNGISQKAVTGSGGIAAMAAAAAAKRKDRAGDAKSGAGVGGIAAMAAAAASKKRVGGGSIAAMAATAASKKTSKDKETNPVPASKSDARRETSAPVGGIAAMAAAAASQRNRGEIGASGEADTSTQRGTAFGVSGIAAMAAAAAKKRMSVEKENTQISGSKSELPKTDTRDQAPPFSSGGIAAAAAAAANAKLRSLPDHSSKDTVKETPPSRAVRIGEIDASSQLHGKHGLRATSDDANDKWIAAVKASITVVASSPDLEVTDSLVGAEPNGSAASQS